MGINYINSTTVGNFVRPTGYRYPVGLHISTASGNAATLTTGGTQTIDGSNTVHTFTSSGSFVPSFTGVVEYLVVGGGFIVTGDYIRKVGK